MASRQSSVARPGGAWQAALAVFWSFFGIRKRRDYDADAEHLKPAQVIVAGLIGAGVFVAILLLVVYLATRFL